MGSIPPGGYRTIIFADHLDSALEVGAFADHTLVVPEYSDLNNKDTLIIEP